MNNRYCKKYCINYELCKATGNLPNDLTVFEHCIKYKNNGVYRVIETDYFTHFCKSDFEYRPSKNAIFAKIVDETDDTVTIERFTEYGKFEVGNITLTRENFVKHFDEIKRSSIKEIRDSDCKTRCLNYDFCKTMRNVTDSTTHKPDTCTFFKDNTKYVLSKKKLFTHIGLGDWEKYPSSFSLFARVLKTSDNNVTYERFNKFGCLMVGSGPITIEKDVFEKYYKEI